MMLSPEQAMVAMAWNWAAMPLEVATAWVRVRQGRRKSAEGETAEDCWTRQIHWRPTMTPPSKALMRFSKTSLVGFMMRLKYGKQEDMRNVRTVTT